MRTFLFLLVLLAGAAAGYEYFQHTQEAANYIDQRARYGPGLEKLKADNKELLAEQAALTKKLTDLQSQEAELKEQAATAQDAAGQASPPTPAPTPAPATAPAQ